MCCATFRFGAKLKSGTLQKCTWAPRWETFAENCNWNRHGLQTGLKRLQSGCLQRQLKNSAQLASCLARKTRASSSMMCWRLDSTAFEAMHSERKILSAQAQVRKWQCDTVALLQRPPKMQCTAG